VSPVKSSVVLLVLGVAGVVYHLRAVDDVQRKLGQLETEVTELKASHRLVEVRLATCENPSQSASVPFEFGASEMAAGDSITIDSIESRNKGFTVGGRYLVRGRYTLASHASAALVVSVTRNDRSGKDTAPARLEISKGVGSFELPLEIGSPGHPHVTLYDPKSGLPFSGVYFGAGGWLLAAKSWSYSGSP